MTHITTIGTACTISGWQLTQAKVAQANADGMQYMYLHQSITMSGAKWIEALDVQSIQSGSIVFDVA